MYSWSNYIIHLQIDNVNDMFVEARDLIEDARDEAETVYFNEAHTEAKEAVDKTVQLFDSILNSLSESERGKLQRMMGLKIEQLKAEVGNLDTLHA